jgi:hypothetical protein
MIASRKQVHQQTTDWEDKPGFEDNIARTLKLDRAALRASQLAEQFIGTHLGTALAAIHDSPPLGVTGSAPPGHRDFVNLTSAAHGQMKELA